MTLSLPTVPDDGLSMLCSAVVQQSAVSVDHRQQSQPPQWRGSPLLTVGRVAGKTIRKLRPHVVKQHVSIGLYPLLRELRHRMRAPFATQEYDKNHSRCRKTGDAPFAPLSGQHHATGHRNALQIAHDALGTFLSSTSGRPPFGSSSSSACASVWG